MAIVGNFTYSGDPAYSSRDAVRFLIRDTIEATAQLSDEEIDWLLSEAGGGVYPAAIQSVDFIANNYATVAVSRSVGALSISYASRADEYRKLGAALRLHWARHTTFVPYAGGISKADKAENESDLDWDQTASKLRMHDIPGGLFTRNST